MTPESKQQQAQASPRPWRWERGGTHGGHFADERGKVVELHGRSPAVLDAFLAERDALLACAEALAAFLRAPSVGSDGPGSATIVVQDFNLRAARAALADLERARAQHHRRADDETSHYRCEG